MAALLREVKGVTFVVFVVRAACGKEARLSVCLTTINRNDANATVSPTHVANSCGFLIGKMRIFDRR